MTRYVLTVGILVIAILDVVTPEWATATRAAAVAINMLWLWSPTS